MNKVQYRIYFAGSSEAMEISNRNRMIWLFVRTINETEQLIPGWAGFISKTGQTPKNLTTIDYYPVINHPITEYKTVQECLRYAEEASEEVGQKYVIITFDLGVCMKAYPLTFNMPEKYSKHIILIGTFHLVCAYMKMIGKKMVGSGLEDVLLEAGLISGGSLSGVLSGKHYSRALHCHKVLLEALERLLIDEYLTYFATFWLT